MMILYDVLFVNPNIRKTVHQNGATFSDFYQMVQKIMITQECARMLIRSKVSMHVETICLLSKKP